MVSAVMSLVVTVTFTFCSFYLMYSIDDLYCFVCICAYTFPSSLSRRSSLLVGRNHGLVYMGGFVSIW